ncbi:CDP-diacylglycerol--glycerol-3-phosphate 3-phosphatidyltransferase [Marmoricola endophyticus]|uniref:CDP-diacylglycerol--glycerol-3-phosphate 3-phosphatidyltransferase n=1 Tax=Marmoricola endophyticus TaxID=2040280 RepID=A0A917BEJ0_9ACTN|nr:CDP-diacylglycerol--glycerol-3-phosphate 3-phosphatidyltransferase [Marmoricola endophyticus]GGF38251.1 CDP-diacylglycerol--glycerol-3-phosphate 3-phosphatidyltransferase [Marmoricola endophyticus]
MSETSGTSNWNVPNALTTLRIVMVPFFAWALLYDGGEDLLWRWVAWLLFALAMLTDKIDGDLARKHGLVTDFGKIADPIADKAITGMAFVGLAIIHPVLPAWLWWVVAVVVLVREWSVTLARLSVAKHVVIAARQSGKVKTVAQSLALGMFIAPFAELSGVWRVPGLVLSGIAVALLAVAVVLTITSGYEFARDAVTQTRERRAERDAQSRQSH